MSNEALKKQSAEFANRARRRQLRTDTHSAAEGIDFIPEVGLEAVPEVVGVSYLMAVAEATLKAIADASPRTGRVAGKE